MFYFQLYINFLARAKYIKCYIIIFSPTNFPTTILITQYVIPYFSANYSREIIIKVCFWRIVWRHLNFQKFLQGLLLILWVTEHSTLNCLLSLCPHWFFLQLQLVYLCHTISGFAWNWLVLHNYLQWLLDILHLVQGLQFWLPHVNTTWPYKDTDGSHRYTVISWGECSSGG